MEKLKLIANNPEQYSILVALMSVLFMLTIIVITFFKPLSKKECLNIIGFGLPILWGLILLVVVIGYLLT